MALKETKTKEKKAEQAPLEVLNTTEVSVQKEKGDKIDYMKMIRQKSAFKANTNQLDQVLSQIEKNHGKGSVMKMDNNDVQIMPVIPTGILGLDLALGIGGIPQGRIVEIYGPESSGKTTLTLHIARECQRQGGTVAFVDAEHALNVEYAKAIGIEFNDKFLLSQPDCAEDALNITEDLVASGAVNLLIVDSVAALVPRAEVEGDMGDSHMGLQARLMSQALRKLTAIVAKSNCTVIFINQLRMKIGVMFGNPETTTGGNSLKFYASVRLDVRKSDTLKDGEEAIGQKTKVKIIKNKVSPPFKEVMMDNFYGKGYSQTADILDTAEKYGVVEKTGAWYSYKNEKIGQGREQSKRYLEENENIFEEIKEEVINRHFEKKYSK